MFDPWIELFGPSALCRLKSKKELVESINWSIRMVEDLALFNRIRIKDYNIQDSRNAVREMVTEYMSSLHGRRIINDYKVVCDETNNTPDMIAHHEMEVTVFWKEYPYLDINRVTRRIGPDRERPSILNTYLLSDGDMT